MSSRVRGTGFGPGPTPVRGSSAASVWPRQSPRPRAATILRFFVIIENPRRWRSSGMIVMGACSGQSWRMTMGTGSVPMW